MRPSASSLFYSSQMACMASTVPALFIAAAAALSISDFVIGVYINRETGIHQPKRIIDDMLLSYMFYGAICLLHRPSTIAEECFASGANSDLSLSFPAASFLHESLFFPAHRSRYHPAYSMMRAMAACTTTVFSSCACTVACFSPITFLVPLLHG